MSYVCRSHLEQSITWRGRGCPICGYERQQRQARLAARRAERLRRQMESE